MKVYIYCTKAKPYLRFGIYYTYNTNPTNDDLNGKIVASFELNRIELIENGRLNGSNWVSLEEFDGGNQIAVKETGLYFWEMESYAKGKDLYEWYIANLKIIKNPTILMSMRFTNMKNNLISEAPKSWCYVYNGKEKCILISIKPERVKKILNRELTIEIRKSYPRRLD